VRNASEIVGDAAENAFGGADDGSFCALNFDFAIGLGQAVRQNFGPLTRARDRNIVNDRCGLDISRYRLTALPR
jgi:hypothetical protein